MENSMDVPQKTINRTALWSCNSTSRDIPKGCKSGYNKDTCTPMFTEALFTITNLWKQPRCSTTDEWMKKKWYLYTMEFYSVIKKNEILLFTGKWMELDNIIFFFFLVKHLQFFWEELPLFWQMVQSASIEVNQLQPIAPIWPQPVFEIKFGDRDLLYSLGWPSTLHFPAFTSQVCK
jgi:hypothetical protein